MARICSASILLAITLSYAGVFAEITDRCLDCICMRNPNNCKEREKTIITDGVCGPYYISRQYYLDAGSPGPEFNVTGYEACCRRLDCSRQCVRQYANKYGDSCTYPAKPTCKDYSRMHFCQCNTGCRTQAFALRESNLALSSQYVETCCEVLGGQNCQ